MRGVKWFTVQTIDVLFREVEDFPALHDWANLLQKTSLPVAQNPAIAFQMPDFFPEAFYFLERLRVGSWLVHVKGVETTAPERSPLGSPFRLDVATAGQQRTPLGGKVFSSCVLRR